MNFLFDDFIFCCQKLRDENKSFVIATLSEKKNSVPQDKGSKIIITLDGIAFGTIGGGALEKNTIEMAQELLKEEGTTTFFKEFNLNKDFKMTCGGSVCILFEKVHIENPWKITVFGAGHVAQALIRTLLNLECNIVCVDTREEWLNKLPISSKLDLVLVKEYTNYMEKIDENSFVIIMTSGHKYDYPILKASLQKQCFPYIGVIGSQSKRARFNHDLKDLNIKGDFYCPIGEKIGTNNPYEVAISIISQLLRIRDK